MLNLNLTRLSKSVVTPEAEDTPPAPIASKLKRPPEPAPERHKVPHSYEEARELYGLIQDIDDVSRIPLGLPAKRYWPDIEDIRNGRFRPSNNTKGGAKSFRSDWRGKVFKANRFCRWCGIRVHKQDDATLDHIIPISRGGLDHPLNYTMACYACNQSKSDMLPEEMIQVILTGMIPVSVVRARFERELAFHRRCETLELDARETWKEHHLPGVRVESRHMPNCEF